jgi:hypothetical protein
MVAQSVALDARDRVTWRAQQEHAFPSDGIDDVANLLVVQQEIDELRDLDAVDRDLRLAITCDDQVLLLGSLQF